MERTKSRSAGKHDVPGSRTRRRLTRDARQRELLEAGMDVLRKKGVAARVEDVTTAANAAKGTFYVYFRTWADFLKDVRDEADAMAGERFEELSREYSDWRSLIFALPRLHLELVRDLRGLEVIYYPALASQIKGEPDANLARLVFFLKEAARAGAIDLDDPERTGRIVNGIIVQTSHGILADGDDEVAACRNAGQFLVEALNVRPLARISGFWPEP